MPASSGPARPWSFGPRPRTGYCDQNMRVSDSERAEVTDRLAAHYGDGRLDRAEFDERVARAMSAKTRADLGGLCDDLPDISPGGAAPGYGSPGTGAPEIPRSHPRRARDVVLFVLLFLLLAAAGQAVAHAFFPLAWVGLVALIVFVILGSRRGRVTR